MAAYEYHGGEIISDSTEIFRVLRALQLTRSVLTLRLLGEKQGHSSLIVDIDRRQQRFHLDEINHAASNALLHNGHSFTLIGMYEGIEVSIRHMQVSMNCKEAPSNTLPLALPTEVFRKQRRNFYRVEVPPQYELTCGVDWEGETLVGRLLNLSVSGCYVEFDDLRELPFKDRDRLRQTQIHLPDQDLCCALLAHNPHYKRLDGNAVSGFSFVGLLPQQQRQLERLILNLQRDQRRLRQNRLAG